MSGKKEAEIYCLAGNLCAPDVFAKIQFPQCFQKRHFDYLYRCSSGNVDQIADELIKQVRMDNCGKVFLLGYSAGGVIALAAASKAPELFHGLILSNTGVCSSGNSKSHFPQELRQHGRDPEFMENFLASCFMNGRLPMEIRDKMLQYALQAPLDKAIEVSASLRQVDYSESIKKYKAPVLILWGEKDRRRTLTSLLQLEECLPQAEVHKLDSGHTPMWDASNEYQKYCAEFLNSLF